MAALGIAVGAMVAVLMLAAGLAHLSATAQAQAAADAGALAGAAVTRETAARGLPPDPAAACAAARRAVTVAGGALARCEVAADGPVTVEAAVAGGDGRARAGWKGVGGGPG